MKKSKHVFTFEKTEDSTGFLLWQVTNLWQREIKKALEKYELTHAQFVLLANIYWLAINEQDATQVLLSVRTKIDPMTTSVVLRALQSRGLIERREHSTDSRAKVIELTGAGRKIIVPAVKTVENFDLEFFKPLAGIIDGFNGALSSLL
jgi:MarR family transcriptional regulator, organic hydroperoxide resistance regulator